MFEDLSARAKLDEEVTAKLRKEQDELLQKDAAASERAGELLAELQTEWDLKLKAEERSAMLQKKANQDAMVIDWLCRERDKLHQTEDRLRLERSTTHKECDWAIREHDKARREAEARRVDLGVKVAQRLDAEEASAGLRADLAEARGLLQVKSDEYDRLSSTVLAV